MSFSNASNNRAPKKHKAKLPEMPGELDKDVVRESSSIHTPVLITRIWQTRAAVLSPNFLLSHRRSLKPTVPKPCPCGLWFSWGGRPSLDPRPEVLTGSELAIALPVAQTLSIPIQPLRPWLALPPGLSLNTPPQGSLGPLL